MGIRNMFRSTEQKAIHYAKELAKFEAKMPHEKARITAKYTNPVKCAERLKKLAREHSALKAKADGYKAALAAKYGVKYEAMAMAAMELVPAGKKLVEALG